MSDDRKSDTLKQLVELIERECGVNPEKIRLESGLDTDLGVFGCDAYDFIKAIEGEFEVDLTKFQFEKSISPENYQVEELVWMCALVFVPIVTGLALPKIGIGIFASITLSIVMLGIVFICFKAYFAKREPIPDIKLSDLLYALEKELCRKGGDRGLRK